MAALSSHPNPHHPCHAICLQFKPAPPNAIGSPEYIADLAEVFAVGRNDSSNRTQEQTDTARFWADGNSEWRGAGGEINMRLKGLITGMLRLVCSARHTDTPCWPFAHQWAAACPPLKPCLPPS